MIFLPNYIQTRESRRHTVEKDASAWAMWNYQNRHLIAISCNQFQPIIFICNLFDISRTLCSYDMPSNLKIKTKIVKTSSVNGQDFMFFCRLNHIKGMSYIHKLLVNILKGNKGWTLGLWNLARSCDKTRSRKIAISKCGPSAFHHNAYSFPLQNVY